MLGKSFIEENPTKINLINLNQPNTFVYDEHILAIREQIQAQWKDLQYSPTLVWKEMSSEKKKKLAKYIICACNVTSLLRCGWHYCGRY